MAKEWIAPEIREVDFSAEMNCGCDCTGGAGAGAGIAPM